MIALLTTLLLGCEAPAPPPPAAPPPPVEQAPAPPPAHQRLEGAAQLVELVGSRARASWGSASCTRWWTVPRAPRP
jgi:hypothetical protein